VACLTPVIDPAAVTGINPNITDPTLYIAVAECAWGQIPESCRCKDSLDQDCVDLIGAYLAAHFGAITVPDAKQEEILKSDVRVNYQLAAVGQGYEATRYGQTANLMLGGCLTQVGISSGQVVFAP
jgi:hypothetical protein